MYKMAHFLFFFESWLGTLTMSTIKFLKYFTLNFRFLQLGGIYHSSTKNSFLKLIFTMYTYFVVMTVFCSYTIVEIMGMAAHLGDIDSLTKLMGFALSHLMGAYKIWIWYTHRHDIRRIVHLLERGEMFQYNWTEHTQVDRVIKTAIKTSRIISMVDFFCGTSLPICASIVAWTTPPVPYYNSETNITLQLYQLPYDTWHPLKARTMPYYPVVFVYQVYCIFIFATDIVMLDTFYASLLIHITTKIHILNMALKTMRERLNINLKLLYDSPDIDMKMQESLQKCIIHHQTIIEMTKTVDGFLHMIIFGQFFASTFILCTCLLSLTINAVDLMRFLTEFAYLTAVLVQLFVYCWFGNGVTYQSFSVQQALYESEWLSSSTKFKRTMIIMSMRTQRPLRLNIGIFAPLTIQTFVTVLRGSYSYFAVLQQTDLASTN